ncbi:hypothetical protein [Thalassobacillus pellis]|uniref:hypothetical protein n=1 Tax=Thalassobacillus pellis TaxID=748008 RepID=UPI00195FCD67|nr:hypothetical protein [Thalassobacillus pellis]MBM7553069.1 hypothetical protein [Thalassobacillus pellis]
MTNNHDQGTPFNDAMEHQRKFEGYPGPGKGRLPLPIRLIGYFICGGIVIMILVALVGNFLF